MPNIGGFILAAGEGRRLRPATLTRPKALVPFCGVPLLELVASQLGTLDLCGTVVNVSYQADRVYEAARRLAGDNGWDLRISQENTLLETGGGLRQGSRLIPDAEHILVHNVDIILDLDLDELVQRHLESEAAVTVALVPGHGPATVTVRPDGGIEEFRNPIGTAPYTFSGVHLLRRDVLDLLPNDGACSVILAYQEAQRRGLPVQAFFLDEGHYWADLGTARQYIRAHGEIADSALRDHPRLRAAQTEQAKRRAALEQTGVICTGALGLGVELSVPAGSQLHNAILWDYTRLPRPLLYADGIFIGNDVPPATATGDERRPDRRVYSFLGLKPEDCRLEPLKKQGSGRQYWRLACGDRTWVWCAYNPERRENSGFSAIADFLGRIGVRVPEVLLHLPDANEIVSRDLGQQDLQRANVPEKAQFLHQVAKQVARLHVVGDKAVRLEELPLQRGFTKGLYDWERDYFRLHLLSNVLQCPDLWSEAASEYCELRTALLKEPLVPIHRDLQSANIMMVDDDVYLIDFQGMRLGAAAYDLGSLLYDPYQCYPAELRNAVWETYCDAVSEFGGAPPTRKLLCAAAVQRLLQALGAYGKLWLTDGLDWYRPFILPGLRMLRTAASETDAWPAMHQLAKQALRLAEIHPKIRDE